MEELPQLRWRGAEEHLAIEAAKLQRQPPPPSSPTPPPPPTPPTQSASHVLAVTTSLPLQPTSLQPSSQDIAEMIASAMTAGIKSATTAAVTAFQQGQQSVSSTPTKHRHRHKQICFDFRNTGTCLRGLNCPHSHT